MIWANTVISFPKSGSAWLRELLLAYGQLMPKGFPRIAFTHDLADDSPAKIISASELSAVSDSNRIKAARIIFFAFRRNIFLMRDPRDVIVSYYHQKTARQPFLLVAIPFVGDMYQFARSQIYGLPKIVSFMNAWAGLLKKKRNYLLLAYEDMHKDTGTQMYRILDHLRIKNNKAAVASAVSGCTFGKLKELEQIHLAKVFRLRSAMLGIEGTLKDNQMHIRKGIVGGYKDELDQESIDYVNNYIATHLDPFYERYL